MSNRLKVLGQVLRSGPLRRVEFAFLGFALAEHGVWVSVLVYAYQRGGASLAAAIAVAQLLPAAVFAPTAACLADSRGAAFALRTGYLAQALSIGTTAACVLFDAPVGGVYISAVIAASAVTITRPAHGALAPLLVDTPVQITAANVVSGWVESLGLLAGPGLAGVMIAVAGTGAALLTFAAVTAGSGLLVASLRVSRPRDDRDDEVSIPVLTALRSSPEVIPVLCVGTIRCIAFGALDVLQVVLAMTVLRLGAGGPGYLATAFGAGATIGAISATTLVGRPRLVRFLTSASVIWGGAFALIGACPSLATTLLLLALSGAAQTVMDVTGRTLLHRTAPPHLHGRVFGVFEGLAMLGLAAGSFLVPALVTLAGAPGAFAIVGALLILGPLTATATKPLHAETPAAQGVGVSKANRNGFGANVLGRDGGLPSRISVSPGPDGEGVAVVGQDRPLNPDVPPLAAFEPGAVEDVAAFEVAGPSRPVR